MLETYIIFSGFSDPYCMLGIQPAGSQMSQSQLPPPSPRDCMPQYQGSPPPDTPKVRQQVGYYKFFLLVFN